MWFLLLWAIGIITAIVHLTVLNQPFTLELVSRTILLHQFVVTFGLCGIIGVIGNIIYADKLSKKLGWPGGPFQIKYGFTQLGLGVLGVMTIWYTDHFWVAALVNMYLYGLSGFWTHTQTMIDNKKIDWDSIGNLIMDIVYQSFLTALSIYANIW